MTETTEEKIQNLKELAQYVLDAKTFGGAFYAVQDLYNAADDHLYDFVNRQVLGMPGWCGIKQEGGWGYEKLTADPYDWSIEFKKAQAGFNISPEQKDTLVKQGINHGWICYVDGSEAHF